MRNKPNHYDDVWFKEFDWNNCDVNNISITKPAHLTEREGSNVYAWDCYSVRWRKNSVWLGHP